MDILIGIIAISLALISYTLYISHTLQRKTKPHAMTWLVWSGLNFFVYSQQIAAGAQEGAWVTLLAGFGSGLIFLLSLRYGERSVTRLDWASFALIALMLLWWSQSGDATLSVIIVIVIYLAGFMPTLRKASKNAFEETATSYALNGAKFLLSFVALGSITFVTAAYPLMLFLVNTGFAVYLLMMRRYHKKPPVPKRQVVRKRV